MVTGKTPSEIAAKVYAEKPWHRHGSLSLRVLDALAHHLNGARIEHSVETGCGKSTILFAQFSRDHTVFTADSPDVLNQAKTSPFLAEGNVNIVRGPTQQTLPTHRFTNPLHAVLLDGPHAYPFPDLEYYFLYPHLAEGALLILDDVDIPTVGNMFRILNRDAMYEHIETVRTTAFLRRTSAPCLDPYGDGWAHQGYNRRKLTTMNLATAVTKHLPEVFVQAMRKVRN